MYAGPVTKACCIFLSLDPSGKYSLLVSICQHVVKMILFPTRRHVLETDLFTRLEPWRT
jgi:hypothetical protein